MLNRLIRNAAVALVVMVAVAACSNETAHARSITLTFIRHAQSQANADGVIDTDVPGPSLTPDGKGQAEQLARQLARNHYDAIYASPMVRTQETAAPLAAALGEHVEVLPGLQEINAGWYDDTPTTGKESTYLLAPNDWLRSDRKEAIPGSINGDQFNDQFTAAVQKIYDSGHSKPIAFSSNTAIKYWALMNVKNPSERLAQQPLPNGARVVITGSPTSGWTLVDWNGISDFSA